MLVKPSLSVTKLYADSVSIGTLIYSLHRNFTQAFPPPLRAASTSLSLSHPEVQVTEFRPRSVSGSGRHLRGVAWLTCLFLSPSGAWKYSIQVVVLFLVETS